MAEVHDGLAGRRQILAHELVDASASLLHQPRLAQDLQMFDAAGVAATAHRRQFGNRPRFAAGQFLEHLPARHLVDGSERPLEVGQRPDCGSYWCSGV